MWWYQPFVSGIEKALTASLTLTATMTRALTRAKTISAALTLTATETRIVAYLKTLSASLTVTATLATTYIPTVPASGEVIDYGRMRKELALAQIRRQVLSEEDFILMLIIES
jgi:hypothetical protein